MNIRETPEPVVNRKQMPQTEAHLPRKEGRLNLNNINSHLKEVQQLRCDSFDTRKVKEQAEDKIFGDDFGNLKALQNRKSEQLLYGAS